MQLWAFHKVFSVDWLLVMAIAVSASFAVAAPFSDRAEVTYHNYKKIWDIYQKSKLNPKDEILDTKTQRY